MSLFSISQYIAIVDSAERNGHVGGGSMLELMTRRHLQRLTEGVYHHAKGSSTYYTPGLMYKTPPL